jgi:acetolactate decarboxylase
MGVPFSAVASLTGHRCFELGAYSDIDSLKTLLNLKIEEDFGLNSMHMVRIDGEFEKICARSESAYRSHHVTLKDILSTTQKDFFFDNIRGTLVCVYFPDYMDGINAPGWHLHFLSEDRTKGGHVFDLKMIRGAVKLDKIQRIEIQLPREPAFDTYALKSASQDEIKQVEQGK